MGKENTGAMKETKKPNIIAFGCYWCGAGENDLQQIEHGSGYKLIKLMCSGRINTALVLQTFERGADGVIVFGCSEGKCHYQEGNLNALEQQKTIRAILTMLGIEPQRFRVGLDDFSKDGKRNQIMSAFLNEIRGYGPTPVNREANPQKGNEKK
jgi:F420-non-reducing hydrogenase iron-sulfur subunit